MPKISLFINLLVTLTQQVAEQDTATPLQNSWNNLPQRILLQKK